MKLQNIFTSEIYRHQQRAESEVGLWTMSIKAFWAYDDSGVISRLISYLKTITQYIKDSDHPNTA